MTRVLVIDDHELSRTHLNKSLLQCGYAIAGEETTGKGDRYAEQFDLYANLEGAMGEERNQL